MEPTDPKDETGGLTRRKLLRRAGITAAAGGAGAILGSKAAAAGESHDMASMGEGQMGSMGSDAMLQMHAGNHEGPTFRAGTMVDYAANGFDPTEILRDFDWGRTSKLPDGRTLREWDVNAIDKELEVAPGVMFPAWTFDGKVPGPTLRAKEGERLRINFGNGSAHPHTMHFHGIHRAEMDGVPGIGAGLIQPGERTVYEFEAEPFGLHLFHCHAEPLAEHIARGMYGTIIIDPEQGRPPADEMVMVQAGYNTTLDGLGNQLYFVNGIPFAYMHETVKVKRNELVRVYLTNLLEYDPVNSFHLHGNFFEYYPTGTRLESSEFTDTISQVQGQRGILEIKFPYLGKYMFHAHKTEFAELGWMGFFEVIE
ncbi:MAG TPA: multicopper oxidase domain-containing protein [Solirubrobacterales bacterium]|nr:multicopper oxidase domain-containing protein [Solirubrobacterales bacterium]